MLDKFAKTNKVFQFRMPTSCLAILHHCHPYVQALDFMHFDAIKKLNFGQFNKLL